MGLLNADRDVVSMLVCIDIAVDVGVGVSMDSSLRCVREHVSVSVLCAVSVVCVMSSHGVVMSRGDGDGARVDMGGDHTIQSTED